MSFDPVVGNKRSIDYYSEEPLAKKQKTNQSIALRNINSAEWDEKIRTALSSLPRPDSKSMFRNSEFMLRMIYEVCKRDYGNFPNAQVEIMNMALDCLNEPEADVFPKLSRVSFDIDLIFNEIYERDNSPGQTWGRMFV